MMPSTEPTELSLAVASDGALEQPSCDQSKHQLPDKIADAVRNLVSLDRLSESAEAAIQLLSDQFARRMTTEAFAVDCSNAGVPIHLGAEAHKAGVRLLFDVFAMTRELLTRHAPYWNVFLREAEQTGLGNRAVVQAMVASSKAAVLLSHCDPHAGNEKVSQTNCEAMISLPCGPGTQQFLVGTASATIPNLWRRASAR